MFLGETPGTLHSPPYHRGGIAGTIAEVEPAKVSARNLQQPADQLPHPVALEDDRFQSIHFLRPRRVALLPDATEQELEIAPERRQGVAQFVGDNGEKLVFGAINGGDLSDILDHPNGPYDPARRIGHRSMVSQHLDGAAVWPADRKRLTEPLLASAKGPLQRGLTRWKGRTIRVAETEPWRGIV